MIVLNLIHLLNNFSYDEALDIVVLSIIALYERRQILMKKVSTQFIFLKRNVT